MTAIDTLDVFLLCAKRADAEQALFEDRMRKAAASRAGVETELATLLPPATLPALAHVGEPSPELPDAIVTLRGDASSLGAALRDASGAIADAIDPARSCLLAARRHAVLPGNDAIRLFFGLRRLERLTLEGFHDYWLNHHAELGRRMIPPYSYHQIHADPASTAELAKAAALPASTLDGIVEVHFPDVDAFVNQLSRPEVAEEALEDERNFIDHSRSIFWAYQTR